MSWQSDDLLAKFRLYMTRAFDAERDSSVFPFWCFLGLEHLGRAVVASISPALLADPSSGDSILHAFGLADTGKSVGSSTVFSRCRRIVETFSDEDVKFSNVLMDRRNAELHTGEAALEDLPQAFWLGGYFQIVEKLLNHLGRELAEVVPADELDWVAEVIASDRESVSGEVKKRINVCRQHFELRPPNEQSSARSDAEARTVTSSSRVVGCPSCGSRVGLRGSLKLRRNPRLRDDDLFTESVYLPSNLHCEACGLQLDGYAELDAAGFGGSYVETEVVDAQDYYFEQFEDYMREPDYGND